MKDISETAGHILASVASDRCGRSLSKLCRTEMLEEATGLLDSSVRPVIVTGFFVPNAGAPETDGPPGAAVLTRALQKLEKEAFLVTDSLNSTALTACCRAVGIHGEVIAEKASEVMELDPDLLVFIERLGRAGDGKYYNMRGEDITGWTPSLDGAAYDALSKGIPVLAVGDGGNEAGMACLMPGMKGLLGNYSSCLSVVRSTVAVPVDVSNWGGYALVCMLSCRHGRWLGHSSEEERFMIEAMINAGAVDGVTGQSILSVDGMDVEVHEEVVKRLRNIYDKSVNGER